jgi:hypothetical protein
VVWLRDGVGDERNDIGDDEQDIGIETAQDFLDNPLD